MSPSKPKLDITPTAKAALQDEFRYCVGGYEPSPAVFERAEGYKLWDQDGREYLDFVAAFSAANCGHCHPLITKRFMAQAQKAYILNLASHNVYWPRFAKMMCQRFGYDKIVAFTSGTEAADNACKIASKWGIKKKGIPADQCLILGVGESYHGLGTQVWNLQDASQKRQDYGITSSRYMNVNPTTGQHLAYLDLDAMRTCLEQHHGRVAAVILEFFHNTSRDLQEEIRYSRGVYDLCKKYNVLCIADEIRQGSGKSGKFFSYNHVGDDCKPDMTLLGKSVSGGIYPQSYVLGTEEAMGLVGTYEIASTFGHTPLGIAATEAALEVIDNENLMEKAVKLGTRWKEIVTGWNHPKIDYVTALGGDSTIFLAGVEPARVAALCMHKGLHVYAKPDRLRLSFILSMPLEELERGAAILKEALDEVDSYGDITGEKFGPLENGN